MEQCRTGKQRVEDTLVAREGVPEASEPLGVSSTRLAPGREGDSSDQRVIGTINHHAKLINNISVGHRYRGCGT